MKTKKLSFAMIFLAASILVYMVASLIFSYTTQPVVKSGEFPFSITYEYKGETKTLSGVVECEYSGSNTIFGDHDRFWDQNTIYDNPENLETPFIIDQDVEKQTTLSLYENISAGYFMGDPQYKNYYEEGGYEGVSPSVSYYDYANGIFLDGKSAEEVLDTLDFKIVDFTYAEPIENSFFLSGLMYEADNIFTLTAIAYVILILCLIFVRKDKEYRYSVLDIIGIVLNFIIALVVVPFLCVFCMLFGIVDSGVVIVDQIIYNLPTLTLLCLEMSVIFRRRGFSKTGFFVQFGSILPIAIIFILELIYSFH